MKTFTATAAQSQFGTLLDDAQVEPVAIEKHGKPSAVVMSAREYERLQEIEDLYWAARADDAARRGFLGVEESKTFIESTLKNA